jgi:hypothetical protein
MSFDTLMSVVRRLTESTESLAVLGAELRLRRDAVSGDPRLRELLTRVATAIEPSLLDGLDAVQESIAHGAIETSFRQAADLLERPARPPGWFYDDPWFSKRRDWHLASMSVPSPRLLNNGRRWRRY